MSFATYLKGRWQLASEIEHAHRGGHKTTTLRHEGRPDTVWCRRCALPLKECAEPCVGPLGHQS